MPKRKDTVTRCKAAGLLESHWRPPQVAKKLYLGRTTAYRWEERMQMFHGQIDRLEHLQMVSYSGSLVLLFLLTFLKNAERLNRIHDAVAKALLEYIQRSPWVYQDEMALFLEEEWDIQVN
jgi:hypothetical protein